MVLGAPKHPPLAMYEPIHLWLWWCSRNALLQTPTAYLFYDCCTLTIRERWVCTSLVNSYRVALFSSHPSEKEKEAVSALILILGGQMNNTFSSRHRIERRRVITNDFFLLFSDEEAQIGGVLISLLYQ